MVVEVAVGAELFAGRRLWLVPAIHLCVAKPPAARACPLPGASQFPGDVESSARRCGLGTGAVQLPASAPLPGPTPVQALIERRSAYRPDSPPTARVADANAARS